MWKLLTVMGSLIAILVMGCAPAALPPATPAPTVSAAAIVVAPTVAPVSAETEAWNKVVAAAKSEGRVTAYTFDMVGDVGIAIAKAFKEEYGITLDLVSGTSLIFLERIKTEYRVGQHAADLMDGSIRGTKLVVDEGFSANASELPVFKGGGDAWVVAPNSWDPQWRNLISFPDYSTIQINTKLVKAEEEPRSWSDLLDPKWKGQILAADPRLSSGMDSYNILLTSQGAVEKDYFSKLGQQNLIFVGQGARGPADALARGEGKIVPMMSTASSNVVVAQGAPIKALNPKEGVIGTAHGITMLNKAPHPNAARVFLNWLFSQNGSAVSAKARGGNSLRKDVGNFYPESLRIQPTKVYMETPEGADQAIANFRDGVVAKLLGATKK